MAIKTKYKTIDSPRMVTKSDSSLQYIIVFFLESFISSSQTLKVMNYFIVMIRKAIEIKDCQFVDLRIRNDI